MSIFDFLSGKKILDRELSKYNGELVVKKDFAWGTYIQADGLTQSGGVVKKIWETTFKKLIQIHPKDVLILGLGGGTIAKLVKKYYPEASITGVEIDPLMIKFGKKYLGMDETATHIFSEDANSFLKKALSKEKKYDLVFVDLYLGYKFPKKFETNAFLGNLKKLLRKDGVVVFNRLYFGNNRSSSVKYGNGLEKVFKSVEWIYPEANVMFVCKDS